MATMGMPVAVIAGKGQELHLAAEGLALTRRGVAGPDADSAVARYDEVASVALDAKPRALRIAFSGERQDWVLPRVSRQEAQWAQELIESAQRRLEARQSPAFAEKLAAESLAAEVQRLADGPAAEAALLAELLLAQAIRYGATDLHLQPGAAGLTVRLRVDGLLRDVALIPAAASERVLARLKVLADLPSYVREVAQTGRLTWDCDGRTVDFRLTCLPTIHGEKLTARLFDPARGTLALGALGLSAEQLARYERLLRQPQGCILLLGPAGSGKSTTLYASLGYLQAQEPPRCLATVEEPAEYDLPGVDQTEVNRGLGLDFAACLRTVLRQDPQVIMVGEIRDPETAAIAVRAGLTGHLVLSTVHAPTVAGAFARLTEMGLEPYLVASSVSAVVAQRLVRRLCPECATSYVPTADEGEALGLSGTALQGRTFRRAVGCEHCEGSGYRGRTGVFELLVVTPELRALITERKTVLEIESALPTSGQAGLWDAGLDLAAQGVTSLDELGRVLGRREV